MANPNIARGLIPVKYRTGQPYMGSHRIFYVPASYGTALFVGDPVIIVTDASDANGVQVVQRASAGATNYISGIMLGAAFGGDPPIPVKYNDARYHLANTAGYVMVADDPELLFEAQEDGGGGVMTVGAVGRNVDLIAGNGVAATGYSGWMLDSNTLGTGNTLQTRIVEAVQRADNDPTSAYAKWLVAINLHSARNLTGV